MTKEITKAILLQELKDKFELRDFEAARFLFDETVVPTYDIGEHVKLWESARSRIAIAANGSTHFFRVEMDERWSVRKIDVFNETGGNFDITQVYLYTDVNTNQFLFHDTVAPIANGTVTMFDLPQDIRMERANGGLEFLYLTVANFVAGGYVTVHMLKEVETIR